ncbi:MAG: sensor histidine kinase [Thermovirgaceae bacterium]|nr:sensor histidine kinase [Thermovirgaceae bacterium]
MRRHLLILLTLAIMIPSFGALFVGGAGVIQHEKTMERVARSYVEDMAGSVAARLEMGWGRPGTFPLNDRERFMRLRQMTWGLSIPGWIAVVDIQGNILMSTAGAEVLPLLWNKGVPVGSAMEVKNSDGEKFTLAAYPAGETGWFVVAAVSWSKLLGPMMRFSRWPIIVGLIGLLGMISVLALWKWLVAPLRALGTEVSYLQWGQEMPVADDPSAVFEIRRLRQVLHHLAKGAMERSGLMKRYVGDIVRVQEEERSRLAREIHDGPLQDVTALIHQIRLAVMDGTSPTESAHLENAEDGARHAVQEMRALCDELSPPWLDLGLGQALNELVERLSRHLQSEISVDVNYPDDLPPEVVLAYFRVVQEAVHNSVRHGRASRVSVRLFEENGQAVLEVEDDGNGFDPPVDYEELRVRGHRGLANMSERMSLIGGKLEVRRLPGGGTLVRCVWSVTSASV